MAAQHAGEAVAGEHGALAGAAAGDHVVGGTAVQQRGGQDAVLDVGQRVRALGGVHAEVEHLVAHRPDDLLERGLDHAVLGVLAVLVDECDFH